ncbi:hypothetical protein [Fibrella forsythiae]|uniref:Outer membrane lipoprotein-sorting protein n=1 Tax=Fibrella forsythiae TaxID=2817061 RepID=A0ABS3JUS0_9BACT|nr:hypothetical protein [Fibrella forsythiae]MBO0953203.1 hypothetical protein [Fibrella forsythiae]
MNAALVKRLLLTACFSLVASLYSIKAQSVITQQLLDYHELKGLLLEHTPTVERILSMKQFKLASTKERPESIIYAYKRENDSTQVLVRVRKSDGLVREIAWHEQPSTLGNLTHDAVYDGFVPVGGNSRYYNRFQKLALFVNYKLANENGVLPCILRAVE